jgi:mono/diheme cytochrome c family protein
MNKALASSLLLVLAILAGCSARRSEPIAGPFQAPSPEVQRGEVVFDRYCSQCHPGGEKGLAPAINNKPLPGFLIKFQVRHGIGAMPSFSREVIGDEDLRDVVVYLKALRRH